MADYDANATPNMNFFIPICPMELLFSPLGCFSEWIIVRLPFSITLVNSSICWLYCQRKNCQSTKM